MNINTIKTQLDRSGYYTQIYQDDIQVGKQPEEVPGVPEIKTFHCFCTVKIRENFIVVRYPVGNLSEEEDFTTVTKAVSYIKKAFPL
jgi:hypothetical protein